MSAGAGDRPESRVPWPLKRPWQFLLGGDNHVLRNMLVLTSGTMAARVIGLAAIPVLTRIFSPEDFGVLAVYTSIVALMVPVTTLRYDMAIPLPRTNRMALNVVTLSMSILLAFTLVQALGLWLFHKPILGLFSAEALEPFWWFIIIGTFGTALYQVLSSWATRTKAFKAIARTQASRALLGSAAKIILGLAGMAPFGLLLGQVIQQAGGSLVLGRDMLRDLRGGRRWLEPAKIRLAARRYRAMPIFRLPSQVLLVYASQAPVLFSSALFGTDVTGQLSLALLALALPMQLFGETTSKAYYAEIAAIGRHHPEKIRGVSISVIWRLAALAALPTIILLVSGPHLFALILGEQWRQAGVFSSLLAIYLAVQFISSPLVHTLNVFDRQDVYLRINIVRAIGVSAVFAAAWLFAWDAYQSLAAYSVGLTLHYIFVSFSIFRIVGDEVR